MANHRQVRSKRRRKLLYREKAKVGRCCFEWKSIRGKPKSRVVTVSHWLSLLLGEEKFFFLLLELERKEASSCWGLQLTTSGGAWELALWASQLHFQWGFLYSVSHIIPDIKTNSNGIKVLDKKQNKNHIKMLEENIGEYSTVLL